MLNLETLTPTLNPTILTTLTPSINNRLITETPTVNLVNFGNVNNKLKQLEFNGLFITLIIQCCVGSLFGLIWLQILKYTTKFIIQLLLFISSGLFIFLIVFGAFVNITLLIYVGLGGVFVSGIYIYIYILNTIIQKR